MNIFRLGNIWQTVSKLLGLTICLSMSFSLSSQLNADSSILTLYPERPLDGENLIPNIEYFQDTNHLSLQEVLDSQDTIQFEASNGIHMSFGITPDQIWLRYRILNSSEEARKLYFLYRNTFVDSMTFFHLRPDGQIVQASMGDRIPFSSRQTPYRHPVFAASIEPGINEFYVSINTESSIVVALAAWDEAQFRSYTRWDYSITGMLFGFSIVMLCYNVFLYFSFKSRSYLYYIGYIGFFCLSQLGFQGLGAEMFNERWGEWLMNEGFQINTHLALLFAMLFAIHFLNMKQFMPLARKISYGICCIIGLSILSSFWLDYGTVLKQMVSVVFFGLSLVMIWGITAMIRGYRPAIYYNLAWVNLIGASITVTLTTMGILPENFIYHSGNFLAANIKFVLMSLALADRVNFTRNQHEKKIRSLNDELQKHVFQVEEIVKERTETISRIVHNVKNGFLTIGKDLQVEEGFTKSCHRLLDCKDIVNHPLSQILRLGQRETDHFELAIEQVFADMMDETVTLSQIPKQFAISSRFLSLDGSVIRNEIGQVTNILFTITDITDLVHKNREAANNGMLLNIAQNITSFRFFLNYVRNTVLHLRAQELDIRSSTIKEFLHTVKGNSSIFGMSEISQEIHHLESKIEGSDPVDPLDQLEQMFRKFLIDHQKTLNFTWENLDHDQISLDDNDLRELEHIVRSKVHEAEPSKAIYEWIHLVQCKTAHDILGPIADDLERIADQYGKLVRFEVSGDHHKITSKPTERLVISLIHLLRNSIVHGIENDRLSLGKPAYGTISLKFEMIDSNLRITVSDDGQGIDIVRMLGEKDIAINSADLTNFLREASQNNTSSFTEADLYAGRGIGVGAIFHLVDQCHGEIKVVSQLNVGTIFYLTIPTKFQEIQCLQKIS